MKRIATPEPFKKPFKSLFPKARSVPVRDFSGAVTLGSIQCSAGRSALTCGFARGLHAFRKDEDLS